MFAAAAWSVSIRRRTASKAGPSPPAKSTVQDAEKTKGAVSNADQRRAGELFISHDLATG